MAFYDIALGDLTLNEFLLRGLFSLLILVVGVLFGKVLDLGLRKLFEKLDLAKHIKIGFVDLTLFIIRWSIYIAFINISLKQMRIPAVTDFVTSVLVTIPAFTAGLLLLILGLALAFYLKKIINISEEGAAWDFISEVVFYFVLMIIGIYAMRIALLPVADIRNMITTGVVIVCSIGIVYYLSKKYLKEHS